MLFRSGTVGDREGEESGFYLVLRLYTHSKERIHSTRVISKEQVRSAQGSREDDGIDVGAYIIRRTLWHRDGWEASRIGIRAHTA